MAKDTRRAFGLRALGAVASTFVGLAVAATPALAATVSGADSYVSAGQNQMTVLTVDGSAGETIYVRVTRGGAVIADRLEYTLGDVADESYGFVALDFSRTDAYDPSQSYVVTAYDSRDESNVLYSGAITPIYASLAGGGEQLIAITTRDTSGDNAFEAPAEITVGAAGEERVFKLDRDAEGGLSYGPADSSASVTGTVSYVTDDGTVVASTTVDGITPTQGQAVDIAATVQDKDGNYYRVIRYSDTVTLTYLANNAIVRVQPATIEDGYYHATVRYVDEDGNAISGVSGKTYSVFEPVSITAPTSFYIKDGSYVQYVLVSESAYVTLRPGDEYSEGDGVVTFTYHKVEPDEADQYAETWTVTIWNVAATRTRDNYRECVVEGPIAIQVEPGTTGTYEVADEYYDSEGNKYVPIANSQWSQEEGDYPSTLTYRHGSAAQSGTNPTDYVYVVPEGYEVSTDPYEITLELFDLTSNSVVRTKTLTISETNANTVVSSTEDFPETFVEDGVTYKLVKGQGDFEHNYFSSTRTYRIYYYDVNDTAKATYEIHRTVYVTLPGGVTYIDGETTTTDNGTTALGVTGVGGTADDGSIIVGELGGETVTIDNGDGTATSTTLEGDDAETVRIDDEANPLAGPDALGGGSSLLASPGVTVALAGVLGVIFAVIIVAWKRRKDQQTENADNDGEVM